MADDGGGPSDVFVFLDECVRKQYSCTCFDARHKPNPGVHFVVDHAPNGCRDRCVILYLFRLIKRGKITRQAGRTRKFVLLTRDSRFLKAVAKGRNKCGVLKVDQIGKRIIANGTAIHICHMTKTACPIQALNEFIAGL